MCRLNALLIIPKSYLYNITVVFYCFPIILSSEQSDKFDGGRKTGPLCNWSHMTTAKGNLEYDYDQIMTYFFKEQKDRIRTLAGYVINCWDITQVCKAPNINAC